MLAPPLAAQRAVPATLPAPATATAAETPAPVVSPAAVPGVVPAPRSAAAYPLLLVPALVGARLATTPGAAVTVQATVAVTSGAPCRSCTVAVSRSVPPVGTFGVAALTLTLPAMPVSIRNGSAAAARPSAR